MSARHADHDEGLIAALAARDAAGDDRAAAEKLVAACAECAALHGDLLLIMNAMPAMPAPTRTRDFRLTAEQAAALRPRGLARVLAPFASARFAFAGPAGAGLAAVGIAGLLLSGSLGATAMPADRAAAPVTSTAGSGAGSATGVEAGPTGAAPLASVALAPADQATDQVTGSTVMGGGATKASQPPEFNAQAGEATPAPSAAAPGTATGTATGGDGGTDGGADTGSPLTGPAALLLGAGVVLVTLRFGARRAVSDR